MAPVAQTITTGYTFSDKVNEKDLPFCLRNVYKIHPDTVSRDKMLLGILNVTSGLMGGANGSTEEQSGIYGIYDGHRVFAPLFTNIYGSAATKKGDLIFCKQLALPEKREMRREFEASMTKFEEEKAAYEAQGKGKNKGERGPAPKEPVFRDPFMPGNSSSSAVYRALDANGGWGIMFETEADTVSNMLDSDYGHYSDLMRKAYHHETVSMNRVSDKIHIDIEIHASLCSSPAPLARFLVFSHRLRMAWAVDSSSTTCLTTRWSFTMYSPVATPLWKTPISRWAKSYCLSITLCWRERAILSSLS